MDHNGTFIQLLLLLVFSMTVSGLDSLNSCNCTSNNRNSPLETSTEKQLTKYLVNHYQHVGRGGRPVLNTSTAIKAEMFFALYDLNLDENEKVLTTSMWVYLTWKDEYLQWNSADYEGLDSTRLECTEIWTPDIMLYNTAEPDSKQRNSLIKVQNNGLVHWNKHQIFKSSCALNVSDFPFDTQICHMWFGPWTHNVSEIDMDLMHPSGIDLDVFLSQYGASNEWNITQLLAERDIENGTNCILKYELHLQRKMVFSSYILTLPCVFLAALTLVVFCLPPERPDRTGLGMSLFSSFLVLLLILVEAAPSSASSVPKLGIYYCCNMVIIMLSIFLSSIVVNLHKTGKSMTRVPYCINVLFLKILGKLLLVTPLGIKNCCLPHIRRSKAKMNNSNKEENFALINPKLQNRTSTSTSEPEVSLNESPAYNTSQCFKPSPGVEQLLLENVNRVSELKDTVKHLLDCICAKERSEFEHGEVISEWHQLAKVVDRLLFVIYLFAITLSLVYSFPEPPIIKYWKT